MSASDPPQSAVTTVQDSALRGSRDAQYPTSLHRLAERTRAFHRVHHDPDNGACDGGICVPRRAATRERSARPSPAATIEATQARTTETGKTGKVPAAAATSATTRTKPIRPVSRPNSTKARAFNARAPRHGDSRLLITSPTVERATLRGHQVGHRLFGGGVPTSRSFVPPLRYHPEEDWTPRASVHPGPIGTLGCALDAAGL